MKPLIPANMMYKGINSIFLVYFFYIPHECLWERHEAIYPCSYNEKRINSNSFTLFTTFHMNAYWKGMKPLIPVNMT